MFKSRRINGYIVRELFGPTVLGLSVYTFFLLMNHFFLVAEKAISKNLGTELTLKLFLLGIPELLVLSIPMSVLLGTLIAVGRLSADHEWVGLQGAGLGPTALLRPAVTHASIWVLISAFIYFAVVPQAHYALRQLRGEMLLASNLAAEVKPGGFYDLPARSTLFVENIRPGEEKRLEGVLFIQVKDGNTQMALARYADLYPDPDGGLALYVNLYDGVAQVIDPKDEVNYWTFEHFERYTAKLPLADYLGTLLAPPDKQIQDFNLGELTAEISDGTLQRDKLAAALKPGMEGHLRVAHRRVAVAKIELQRRIALPLASLFFALLAVPLGITGVRSGKGAGFALSILIILIYRASFVHLRTRAMENDVPAELGAWGGNLVIILWAAYALWSMYRRSGRPGLVEILLSGPMRLLRWTLRLIRRRPDRSGSDEGSDLSTLAGTPSRFVGRLDQFIAFSYLRVLLFTLLSAYVIYGLVELQPLVDDALRTGQPMSLVLSYLQYLIPVAFHVVLPLSCLIGAVVAFTILARSGELVAIKASGTGMRRATIPVIVLTVGLCVLLFVVQDRIAPAASRHAQALKDQLTGKPARTYGVPAVGRWSFGPDGRQLYHYRLYDAKREEFRRLNVFTLDRAENRILDHRFGERARWNGTIWELDDGWYRTFPFQEAPTLERFEGTREVVMDPPSYFVVRKELSLTSSQGDVADQMSVGELRRQIKSLDQSGYDITRLKVAYYGKFSNAVSPLVMVLLGLPFAFKVGRRGSLYGIGVALLLVLVYWATFAIFNALGLETLLRPYVAAWAPNVLFGLLGIYLMLYIRT